MYKLPDAKNKLLPNKLGTTSGDAALSYILFQINKYPVPIHKWEQNMKDHKILNTNYQTKRFYDANEYLLCRYKANLSCAQKMLTIHIKNFEEHLNKANKLLIELEKLATMEMQ